MTLVTQTLRNAFVNGGAFLCIAIRSLSFNHHQWNTVHKTDYIRAAAFTPPERVTVNSSVNTKLLLAGFCQSIRAMVGLVFLPSTNSVTEMPYNKWLYRRSLAVSSPSFKAGLHTSAIRLSMDFSDSG